MEDFGLPESPDCNIRLCELLREDIEDLGVSSPDWWHEAVEAKGTCTIVADNEDCNCTSEVCSSRSPVFKTPEAGLKSKRNRKSCLKPLALSRQRGIIAASPDSDGSSEVDWYSPFKSANLSPIPPFQLGGGMIPKSLEPLLEEGSDMSWNSGFMTPLASSVTCSSLTSNEKKVVVPQSSHRMPRVLFLADENMDDEDCCKTIDWGKEMSQKALTDTTLLNENSYVDKTEFNIQDTVLLRKENVLCCSSLRYTTDCKKNVDTPVTETDGNILEEKSSYSVNLSMDIIQKCNETNDTEKPFQEVKSYLVQDSVQEVSSSDSVKERSQCNFLQRHSLIKSPDSGMNDFTENSVEIAFSNSSPLVSGIGARMTVPRRLFHGNRHVGVHEEGNVTEGGVARVQIDDSGAIACGGISQGRSSGSVGTAKCSQYDAVVSNEVEVIGTSAVNSTEDFPQDLSVNTLEEICQVTELLATDADTPIEFSQNSDDMCGNKETPVCVQLSAPDKSCFCRTSTPICCRNKHSKLDSGKIKKQIKFVHVYDNEKPNKDDGNIRIMQENSQKQYEFEDWQHGDTAALEQSIGVLDNNSVVDISSRVQTIKKTLNQIKKFSYVPSNIEMKAAVLQNSSLSVLMEDVVQSAQAMENVLATKAKQNSMGKLNAVARDRQGFIPFCKLEGLCKFVTKEESSEDFKVTNRVTDTSDSKGEPSLISCNHSLINSTGETCDQAISTGNQGSINKFTDVGGGTNAKCKSICSAQCDYGTSLWEKQSGIFMKNTLAARKFKQSSEVEKPCNNSGTICDIQGDSIKQLDVFSSGSKNEMDYEFPKLNQPAEMFGFISNTGKHIGFLNEALMKNVRLKDGILIGEEMRVSPEVTLNVPGQHSKCEELKDMKTNAVHSPYTDSSCEQSNATAEHKSDECDNIFRQGHTVNKNNLSLICVKNINKQEIVRHVETTTHQNCNRNEMATEDNTVTFLEHKKKGENIVTDLQIVLAAEEAELMQQLVEDGSIFSQWPIEVHTQEMEVCDEFSNPTTETKFPISPCDGKGNAEQKESCYFSHGTSEPQEDVSMSDGISKSLFSKLTSLCTADCQNAEVSEWNLQQIEQWHQNDITCDSTEREGNESGRFTKVIQIVNVSDSGSSDQVKKPRSEEVDIEVLSTAGSKQPFSDNFDTLNIENRIQMLINNPENKILNVDDSVLTTPGSRMQNVQPAATDCVALHDLRMETVLCKSDNKVDMKMKTDFPVEHPGATKLLRAKERNLSVSGTAVLNANAEDERQKSENIPIIDYESDTGNIKFLKSNIGVGGRVLLEKVGETRDSLQAPVTNTGNSFEVKNPTPLKFGNVNDCVTNIGKSDQDSAETPSCLLENENPSQQLLQQSDGTVNVSERLLVESVEVPEQNVINSSRNCQNPGDLLHNVQSVLNCNNNMAVDSITTVSGRKMVVSAKALTNAKHMFPEVDANVPTTLQNSHCPTLECPEAVDAALIHNVSNTQYSGHEKTECSELEGAKEEGPSNLQGLSAVNGQQISVSVRTLSTAKLLSSNQESVKGELVTESLEMKEMKQKVSLFQEYKTRSSVQISETLNIPDFVISEVDTTMVERNIERELEKSKRQELPVSQGFKTASGNEIFVSDKASNRAKLLISEEDIHTKPKDHEIIASELNDPQKISSPVLHRHSVASKKGIAVSPNNSNAMKLLFSEKGTGRELAEDGRRALELEEEAERSHSPVFQGLSTASGKRASVSATFLKRAKQVFSEEESREELVEDGTNVPEIKEKEEPHSPVIKGFSTASGKRVSVSAASLKRVKQMFSEEESLEELMEDGTSVPEVKEKQEPHSPVIKEFSTASGKRVSVSAVSLNRAKQMFSQEKSCEKLVEDGTSVPEIKEKEDPHSPVIKGFSTASGKRVSVSAVSLKRAKQMFSEEESHEELVEDGTSVREVKEKEEPHSPVIKGFSTASGKRVSVSAVSLNRAKQMFSQEESCEKLVEDGTSVPEIKEKEEPHSPVIKGFSTASGKRVSVSAVSLKRVKRMFSQEESCEKLVEDGTSVPEIKEKEEPHSPVLKGFSTASGKRVSVSAVSLKRAKQMFSEEESREELVEDETSVREVKEKEEPHSPIIKGFSTASGKRVSVSAASLKRAKQMFSEEKSLEELMGDGTSVPELKEKKEPHSPVIKGFSTASGKRVPVSAVSLKRAKQMFSEEESHEELAEDGTSVREVKEKEEPHSPVIKGFSTASGKRVSVSAVSLNRAKQMFSEEESLEELMEDGTSVPEVKEKQEPHSPVIKEFSTASGKRVSVSAVSLNRAKQMFSQEKSCEKLVEDGTSVPEIKEKEDPHSPVIKGFSTASGKRVSVSAVSLKRAKQMFSEEESHEELVEDGTSVREVKEKEEPHSPVIKGFSTASGKRVSVSAVSLNRAKQMFSQEESCEKLVEDGTSVPEIKEKEEPHSPIIKGFSTASGKRVSVSAVSLKRAKQMFSEEESHEELAEDGTSVREVKEKEEPHSPVIKGFSTASGKRVSVSAVSLKRAKQMFSEEESLEELVEDGTSVPEIKEKEEPHSPVIKGFSTASGKRVSVSAEGLKRAKLMFLGEEFRKELVPVETEFPLIKGNKKKYLPPEKNIVVSESEDLWNKDSPLVKGFSTGSEKQVFETVTGLNRSKVLFSEIATACTEIDAHVGNDSHLNEEKEIFSQISQKLLPVIRSCESESTEFLNTERQFIYNTCANKYLEYEKSPVDSETSPRHQIVSVLKEMPKKIELELPRSVLIEEKSIEIVNSHQISSSRPLLLSENETKTEDCKQDACISEEISHRAGTLNGFRNVPNFERKLHDCQHPSIQVDSCSADNTGAKIVKDKERYDLGRDSPQCNAVTEDHNKTDGEPVSLTQEVRESAAALLADEAMFNSPAWIGSYVSCPDMLYDRCTGPPARLCSEVKDCSAVTAVDPGSPVLGSHHSRKRQRGTMNTNGFGHNFHTVANSSFKVPYKNTAASAGDVLTSVQLYSGKRTSRHLEFGTPFSKRLRTAELSKKASSQEPCRQKSVLGEREVCPEVLEGRQAAAKEQVALVRSKMSAGNSGLCPCNGSYYVRKQERHLQVKWKEAVRGARPGQYTRDQLLRFGLKESILNVSAVNAAEFRFSAWDHYSSSLCLENVTGILVGDGAHLVLDAKGTAGVEEVTRAFLSSPGIEVTLVPAGWVQNHYRWLVWKLASVERSFPQQFAARCLTPNMLLLQLKYRYDREIEHCHRSAIRKILERDDSSARRFVLCVARVIKLDSSEADVRYELELTDGWYGLTAVVDQELCQRIHHGTVAVGTKLISYGAELLNCEQGCSPLENGGDVKLKLYSNSTRRTRWDTKLGFHKYPGPLHISLTSILPGGGNVSSVSVTVVRVYPLLYVEKLGEGKSVSRPAWAEERAAVQWERKRREYVEQVYTQLKIELHKEDSKQRHLKSYYHIPSASNLAMICSGDKLCEILELAPDPASVEALLNEEQKVAIAEYQRSKCESVQRELEAKVREKLKESPAASRTVTPLFKVRCVDPAVPMSTRSAVLSVWRPSEDVIQLLKEGITVTLFNIAAAGVRNGDLKLSAGRQTIYRPSSCRNYDFHERRVMRLSEVTHTDFHPPFGELDVVGMVAYIGSSLPGNSGFQTVYLADTDFNILGLSFWGGVKQFGWDEVLKPRALVAASNLQWRHGAAVRWVPCAYVSELSSFSLNPCQLHLQQALATLRQEVGKQDFGAFAAACEDKVSTLLRGCTSPFPRMVSGYRTSPASGGTPQASVKQGGLRPPLSRIPINSPKTVSPQVACAKERMPLLSSPLHIPQASVTCSSNVVTNSIQTERRLHKLQLYGEPPPLSPLLVMPVTPTLRKEFHVPLRKGCPVSSTDNSPLSLKRDPS